MFRALIHIMMWYWKHINWIPFGLNWSGRCWNASNALQLQMGIQSIEYNYSFFKIKKKKKCDIIPSSQPILL